MMNRWVWVEHWPNTLLKVSRLIWSRRREENAAALERVRSPRDWMGWAGCGKRNFWRLLKTLGIREVRLLDYIDGDLDQADPAEVVAKIVAHLRRVKPEVVITFGPEGAYGHPDHIAISQLTTAAVVCAAHSNDTTQGARPTLAETHRVSKILLYGLVQR